MSSTRAQVNYSQFELFLDGDNHIIMPTNTETLLRFMSEAVQLFGQLCINLQYMVQPVYHHCLLHVIDVQNPRSCAGRPRFQSRSPAIRAWLLQPV